ncbi:hypothetical protein B5P41_34070, partial [Bacillus sp. SRB_28]
PTQFDPLNKNMKSNFRNHARILRYMEITIIGVSEAHFRAFLGSFQYLPLGNIRPRMSKKRTRQDLVRTYQPQHECKNFI